ncbi:MAG: ATP-binding protein [Candidatus Aenigmatarchaeota archaeon]
MEKYFVDKKESIKKQEIVERLISVNPTKEFGFSVIGPRRSGKTFFLYSLIKKFNLDDEDYLFINFEDDEIKSLKREDLVKCVQKHVEVYGKEPEYIFLDEIQNLERWQSFVYSLIEKKKYFVFLTGSSSKLLSKEIATQLRGRSLDVVVFPFGFKEFLKTEGIEQKKLYSSIEEGKIKNLLKKYLTTGGFPQVVLKKIDNKTFSREYIDVVLYKDLVERYRIENVEVARFLLYSVLQSFAKEFSLNRIFNQLKGRIEASIKTLYQYFSYLEEVFFSFCLRKFSFSLKKSLLTIPKVYVNDVGLVEDNIGRKLENLVFIELKKKELGKLVEIFYWKDQQKNEVDFVLKEGLKVKQLIQATYASAKDEIEKREIKALIKASDELKCKNLLVITWDYEDEIKLGNKKIVCKPLWKWLLE